MPSEDGFWALVGDSPPRTILRMDAEGNEIEPRLEGSYILDGQAVEWGDYILERTYRGVYVRPQVSNPVASFGYISFAPHEFVGDEVFVVAEGLDAWVIYKRVGPDEVRIQKLVYPPTFQPLRQ